MSTSPRKGKTVPMKKPAQHLIGTPTQKVQDGDTIGVELGDVVPLLHSQQGRCNGRSRPFQEPTEGDQEVVCWSAPDICGHPSRQSLCLRDSASPLRRAYRWLPPLFFSNAAFADSHQPVNALVSHLHHLVEILFGQQAGEISSEGTDLGPFGPQMAVETRGNDILQ
jgi:hypothetical protein